MKTRPEAILAVSQQFKERMSEVIEAVMHHLTPANAPTLLGASLAALTSQGSLTSIVLFALYGDVLRVVRDAILADGELSDGELDESLGLLRKVSSGYATVRKSYSAFATLTEANAREFLKTYEADGGLFGYANASTKWAGVQLCRNIEREIGDSTPLQLLGSCLVEWSDTLMSVNGVTRSEELAAGSLRSLFVIRAHQTDSVAANPAVQVRPSEASGVDLYFDAPDSDGDTQFGMSVVIQNSTADECELVQNAVVLLDRDGLPLEVFEPEGECSIGPEDSYRYTADYLGYVPAALLGGDLGAAQLTGTTRLCKLHYARGPSVDLPRGHMTPEGVPISWGIDDVLEVAGIAVWLTSPDDDDGSFNIQVNAAYRNLTNRSLSKLVIKAQLLDARGREVESSETEESLLALSLGMAEFSFWNVEDKKLVGATVHFEATVFTELMTGSVHASHATMREAD